MSASIQKALLFGVMFVHASCFCGQLTQLEFKQGNLHLVELNPLTGVDLGCLGPCESREGGIVFKNSLKEAVKIGPLRSPCPCIDIDGTVETLKAGDAATLKLTLNGEGYRGSFVKYLHVRFSAGTVEKDVFIPVKFTILEETAGRATSATPPPTPAKTTSSKLRFTDYKGGGLEAYPDAVAWVFAGRGCPNCAILKAELLPELLLKGSQDDVSREIVMVDLDDKEGFIFLADIEAKLGARGSKTPVVLYEGRLIYGNDAIKALIGARGD